MSNFTNILQDIFTVDFGRKVLNDLFVVPGKAFLEFTAEYLSGPGLNPLSFLGYFVVLFGATAILVLAAHLVRVLLGHMIFLYKEKKRKQIRAIKKRERERTAARIASEREFEEMYNQYGDTDYSHSL